MNRRPCGIGRFKGAGRARSHPPISLEGLRPYVAVMSLLPGILLFIGTLAAMEGFAYAAHRWVMHGPGWFLHASHHRPRTGLFETNDLYAVIFALPSLLLILGGLHWGWGAWAVWVGAGVAAYGFIYFCFHDVIVHKRIGHRYVARSTYMKRIVQAHRLHHAVETKEGAVSFGFLYAPRADALKAELVRRNKAGLRSPAEP
jgi:beta-carotene 3-hydroxylase